KMVTHASRDQTIYLPGHFTFRNSFMYIMIRHLLLLLISTVIQFTETCFPTSPVQMPVMNRCQMCGTGLIAKSTAGAGVFDLDTPAIVNECKERTITCVIPGAYIQLNNDPAKIINDGDTGTATLVVRCNAAGTQWLYQGAPVTDAVCGQRPCATCASSLILIEAGAGWSPDTIAVVGGCAVRKRS
ncbi:hypothetical protein PENTCL1PPCAC_13427, partial [Pristionchus entomophagus]